MSTRLVAGVALAAWLAAGLYLTLRPVIPLPGQVVDDNFVLFHTFGIYFANLGSQFWVGQMVGNLVLLLPLGLLGPLAVPALDGWLRVLLAAAVVSIGIEAAQLWIPNRSADVDDVVLNVIGALVGYAILVLVRLSRSPTTRRDAPSSS